MNILSIDGGGIRGIIPGMVVCTLEEKLQKSTGNPEARIADFFDFFAGTSTGGILTTLYNTPDKSGRPKFTAKDAVNLYIDNGRQIFERTIWQKVKSGWGILDPKYKARVLENKLEQYLDEIMLSETLRSCIITAYKIDSGEAWFFTKTKAITKRETHDFTLREVCRATSAAPTYFEPKLVENRIKEKFPLIDGGVFANNPALCAYAQVRTEIPEKRAADMFIVSLGTGDMGINISYNKAIGWGAAEWVKPVIDIMMSGVSQTVDYQLKQIFGAVGKPENYVRIDPPELLGNQVQMDNVSADNIRSLVNIGRQVSEDNNDKLDEIVSKLIGVIG